MRTALDRKRRRPSRERANIGHRAVVHGCEIGADALVGINAIVLDGTRIGAQSIVGALSPARTMLRTATSHAGVRRPPARRSRPHR